jgi:hypothetical protein
MVLLGAKPTSLDITSKHPEEPKTTSFFVFTLVSLVLIGTSYRSLIVVPGLFIPLLFIKREDRTYLGALILVLLTKICLGYFLEPSAGYAAYKQNNIWLLREPTTILLFFTWILFGYRYATLEFFTKQNWKKIFGVIIAIYVAQFLFDDRIILSGISSAQALAWFLFFILLIGNAPKLVKFIILALIIGTGFIPMDSSFTMIASMIMGMIYVLPYFHLTEIKLQWRIIAIFTIALLMVSSTFAYLVYVRETRATGEANNGYARAILAEAGYELGWSQYFTDPEEYNIYNLSFHDSFIYILVRYGIFSIVLYWLIVCRIPSKGRLPLVLFGSILLLSTGANVVIESLRAGPGVGMALGALFSAGETSLHRTKKPRPVIHPSLIRQQ